MIDETGRGHDLPVADQRGVLLRAGRSAENVARVNRKIDQKAGHFLTFANIQLTRPRLPQPLDLRALRIAQARVQPSRDDLLIVGRVSAINRAGGRRALRQSSEGKEGQEN